MPGSSGTAVRAPPGIDRTFILARGHGKNQLRCGKKRLRAARWRLLRRVVFENLLVPAILFDALRKENNDPFRETLGTLKNLQRSDVRLVPGHVGVTNTNWMFRKRDHMPAVRSKQ